MNKPNLLLKFFSLLLCFTAYSGFAQEIDTVELNGQQYFVYPFSAEVTTHSQYGMAIKGNRGNSNLSFTLYKEIMGMEMGDIELTRQDFRRFKREVRQYEQGYEMDGGRDEYKHLNKKFYKAVRKNPYPLLQQRFRENDDLTPVLDPIPDGQYVQFYEPMCIIDEKGRCKNPDEEERIVAGYFTIKNNLLEGEAKWVDFQGNVLKQGKFVNGSKEGEWKYEYRFLYYAIEKDQAELYIERGYPDLDTVVEYYTYRKGAKQGHYRKYENSAFPTEEGDYENGEETGTWISRLVGYTGQGSNRKLNRNNDKITTQYTYETNDSLLRNPIWIRKDLASFYGADMEQFNFYGAKYGLPNLPQDLYRVAFPVEEDLELEEETEGAPYDMDYYEEDMYYEGEYEEGYYEEEMYGEYYGGGFGYDMFSAELYDPSDEKYKMRGLLLDSIGGFPKYTGVYEEFYPNGQLAFRYNFEDGNLVLEDTIFWDNGKPFDVITEVPDSNQYLRSIYDYDGKLYEEIAYDSKGDFIRIQNSLQVTKKYILDGFEAELALYGSYYLYDKDDTLGKSELTQPLVLFRSWAEADSSMLFSISYSPEDRRLTSQGYSVMKNEMSFEEKTFSENFESWTGKKYTRFGNLELERTSSGSYLEYYDSDSIPIRNIRADERFSVASQYELKKDGQLYTGPVELKLNQKKLSMSKSGLELSLPSSKYTSKKLTKDIKRYRSKGKTKYPIEMSFLDATELESDLSSYVFREFFSSSLGRFFNSSGLYYDEYYDERVKKRDMPAQLTTVEGYMLDGKPHGLWTGYDQFGKKFVEVSYVNGEASGELIEYEYAEPVDEDNFMYMEYGYENVLTDSFPEKKVHFVSYRSQFLNGKENGESVGYTWYGDVISRTNYVDGFMDGMSMERNKLATTFASYKYGSPDGYVRTYLTLPKKDSILLYNLNFQDGVLQGESKAFHTNGQLAKRGFFLDGRPIEDYEAYDSLGFKYHYVKFQYSFPVEEKIWEENQLSVRYLFKWEDSIYFEPRDITTSQSLDAVIAELGLGGDYFERPYYGRPSLVNKNYIEYHMTKYYPNDTISRDGDLNEGRKIGCWRYYSYNGELLYEVDYKDSIIVVNDSVKFKSKGVLTDFNANGDPLYEAYVIEMSSKYDCSHSDHYEVRQLYTRWEANDSIGRMNGYVQNFYDNGTLQNEGRMKDGLPDGVWKYYDPYGKLNQYGVYVLGKRDARWLSGDLSKTKYLGDICLNPNLPDLEDEMRYRENLLDIKITNYSLGKALNTQYYDINMNQFIDAEEMEEEDSETPDEELEGE